MQRIVEGKRLVYYFRNADSGFWDENWRMHYSKKFYESAETGELERLGTYFLRYLPKDLPILEAGCGLAQYVVALRARGYNIEGIDWATETIGAVSTLFPDLPVRTGNVMAIDVPDNYYGAYISLGVMEHRYEGPEPFLEEAFRVLKPGGVALISVPYFNALCRFKRWFGAYAEEPVGLRFYQYAFRVREFTELVLKVGFEITNIGGYDSYKGVTDEIRVLRRLLNWNVGRYNVASVVQRVLYRIPLLERYFGHMLMVVCYKK